jgi:beta-glucanase (GH16 family)
MSMKHARVAGCLLTAGLLVSAVPVHAQTWNLVWSDEMNAANNTPPDSTKWVYDVPTAGSSNSELETYCGQAGAGQTGICANWLQNAHHDGAGNLVISARLVSGQWTSARLNSSSKFTPTYGKIEARIKLPFANGLWPAFWLLGANIGSVGWPGCGEEDIMENVPQLGASTIRSSLHGNGYSGANSLHADFTFPSGGRVDTAYHVYGMIWSANQVQYYVDGTTFATFTPASMPAGGTWAFNGHPFFMLLNLAVGGNWPTPPDGSTPNPANMYVDYVRVYQASAAPTPTPAPAGAGTIVNKNSGKCVDAAGASTANGTAVQQYTCNSTSAQAWTRVATSGGYVRVGTNNNTNQVWDVAGVSTADGAKTQLWAYGGGNNQQWLPVAEGGGYYHLIARHSGKCLDVPNASTADGVQLQQWTCNNTAAQSFLLN